MQPDVVNETPTYPRIPYGEADFRRIRLNRWLYVDKTRFLRRLKQERCAFLIRPPPVREIVVVSLMENYCDRYWGHEFDAVFAGTDIGQNPTTACAYLNSTSGRSHVLRRGKTTSDLNTTTSDVKACAICVPPLDLRRRYTQIVDAARATATMAEANSTTGTALTASLMPRLLGVGA